MPLTWTSRHSNIPEWLLGMRGPPETSQPVNATAGSVLQPDVESGIPTTGGQEVTVVFSIPGTTMQLVEHSDAIQLPQTDLEELLSHGTSAEDVTLAAESSLLRRLASTEAMEASIPIPEIRDKVRTSVMTNKQAMR